MVRTLEMGLDTFGDVTEDATGALKTAGQVIRDVIDEAVLADQLGVDFFGLGEHHRGHRRQDQSSSTRFGGDGPQFRRPGPGLSAIF